MKKQTEGTTVLINISEVENNPLNPRRAENPRFGMIRDSIALKGVNTTPIEVYENPKKKGHYLTLGGGGTRLRALQDLDAKKVLCIIRPDPRDENIVRANHLNENMARGETTFYETASAVTAMLAEVFEKSPRASLKKQVEFLNSKGLAVGKTAISLYTKADFLFSGWLLYHRVSKRLVETASLEWGGIKKVISEYNKVLSCNRKEMRRHFIAPAIAERNRVLARTPLQANVVNREAFDEDRQPHSDMAMELRLLFKEITQKVSSHFASEEVNPQRGVRTEDEGAEIVNRALGNSRQDARRQSLTEISVAESGGNGSDASEESDGGSTRVQSYRINARRAIAGRRDADSAEDEAIESAKTEVTERQEAENERRRLTVTRFRQLLESEIEETERKLASHGKKKYTVQLPYDLAAGVYAKIMSQFVYRSGDEQANFLLQDLGRIHSVLTGEELNLSEILAKAKEEVNAEIPMPETLSSAEDKKDGEVSADRQNVAA